MEVFNSEIILGAKGRNKFMNNPGGGVMGDYM